MRPLPGDVMREHSRARWVTTMTIVLASGSWSNNLGFLRGLEGDRVAIQCAKPALLFSVASLFDGSKGPVEAT
ncbi:MAG: hypothetical protein KGS44_02785 [Alphaproteobacteria bacterium]|jgi:hypothetical protein|nr:hypothetical protein [Alphaproteobacteria bacterium]